MKKKLQRAEFLLWDLRTCAGVVGVGVGIGLRNTPIILGTVVMLLSIILVFPRWKPGMLYGLSVAFDSGVVALFCIGLGWSGAIACLLPLLTLVRFLYHKESAEEAAERFYERLKELQNRLVATERLAVVGELSSVIAHQVRNPLTSISLNLELLEESLADSELGDDPEIANLITSIRQEVDNLSEISEHYLQFGKLPEARFEKGSVSNLLLGLAKFLKPEMERRGLSFDVDVPPALPEITMDEVQLRVALTNLLRNAIEATKPGGKVKLSACVADGRLQVTLSDTGVGMTEAELQRAFQIFYTTKENGCGLGLTVAESIIEAHRGKLDCESMPGLGTTFRIYLPLEVRDGEASGNTDR